MKEAIANAILKTILKTLESERFHRWYNKEFVQYISDGTVDIGLGMHRSDAQAEEEILRQIEKLFLD